MPHQHSFEYAILRVVPQVEREEFLNVGVILYSKNLDFLDVKIHLNEQRIFSLNNQIDLENIKCHLDSLFQITHGGEQSGPIGSLDKASRFRWLTAKRSTIVQSSQVHPGLCTNAEKTLDKLFRDLVLM